MVCTRGGPGISALLLNTGQLLLGRMWAVWRADHTHAHPRAHALTYAGGEENQDSAEGTVTPVVSIVHFSANPNYCCIED